MPIINTRSAVIRAPCARLARPQRTAIVNVIGARAPLVRLPQASRDWPRIAVA